MSESRITVERLNELKSGIQFAARYFETSKLRELSSYGIAYNALQNLIADAMTTQNDVGERLRRMIKDIHIVFMIYKNFSPDRFDMILRNATAGPDFKDNLQNLKWSATRLILTLNSLEKMKYNQSFNSLRSCLFIIYGIGDLLDQIRTESVSQNLSSAERREFWQTMHSKADEIVASCGGI